MDILMVDDNSDIRALFDLVFKVCGYSAQLARHGGEAVAAVENKVFDAIVMDIEMPVMGGLEAMRRIRSLPNGQRVPIVAFTAYNTDSRAALAAGANEFVQKPLDPMALVSHLQQLQAA